MITNIKIKNFALIEDLEINFSKGLNVITGETGAGKSVLASAINFVLGARADKSKIRTNTTEAFVQLSMDVSNNDLVQSELKNQGLAVDDILIISRKLSQDNKNEIRINGQIANLIILRNLTSLIIDICGQHEHQSLLLKDNHLTFLDNYIGKEFFKYKQMLNQFLLDRQDVKSQIKELGGDKFSQEREKDTLLFQIQEIEQAELVEGEDEKLEDKKRIFDNFQKIGNQLSTACQLLNNGSENALSCIFNAKKCVSNLTAFDTEFLDLSNRLDSVFLELTDINDNLENKMQSLDFSQMEYEQIVERLDLIKNLKRKYGNTIEQILEYLQTSKTQLDKIENKGVLLEELTIQLEELDDKILNLCAEMSKIRKQKAQTFENQIKAELKGLGMMQADFKVNFSQIEPNQFGYDDVEFLFSANLGEPLKPLTKVISGGEMSRFMLAFKIVLGNQEKIDTLIFDEIDTGISGDVSVEVGKKLARLAKNYQVLTITHLPTIASFANKHFQIKKSSANGYTQSNVFELDYDGEVQEIARLVGSSQAVLTSIAYAKELKKQAISYLANIK